MIDEKISLMTDPRPLFTTGEAAAILNISAKTLERWRRTGDGPLFVATGQRLIRYRRGALESFIAAQTVRSTAERHLRP